MDASFRPEAAGRVFPKGRSRDYSIITSSNFVGFSIARCVNQIAGRANQIVDRTHCDAGKKSPFVRKVGHIRSASFRNVVFASGTATGRNDAGGKKHFGDGAGLES
jgi:hypothetical protein